MPISRPPLMRGAAVTVIFVVGLSGRVPADEKGQHAPSPVRIERCEVVSRSVLSDPFNGFRQEYVTGVALRYVNDLPQPAKLVEITIRYEGSSQTVTERGSFTIGVPIERNLPIFSGNLNGGPSTQCKILHVRFGNGEIWSAES